MTDGPPDVAVWTTVPTVTTRVKTIATPVKTNAAIENSIVVLVFPIVVLVVAVATIVMTAAAGAATHAADAARSAASGIPATTIAGRGVVPTNTVADITSTSAVTTPAGPPTVPVGTGTMAVTTDAGCLNPLSAATGCPLAAFFALQRSSGAAPMRSRSEQRRQISPFHIFCVLLSRLQRSPRFYHDNPTKHSIQ